MLTIEEIKERLQGRNLSEVARRIGVTRAAIWAYANGINKPSYDMLVKLSEYLFKNN